MNPTDEKGTSMVQYRSEVRDGMRMEWDVPIRMEDGVTLRADIFRDRVVEGFGRPTL